MTQQRDSVFYFDGDADYVKIADDKTLWVSNYTVEVWLKPDGVPDEVWKGIFGKAGPNYNIWLKNTGAIAHRYQTTAGNDIGTETDDGVVKWDKWNHIAITNDGKNAKIYVDGKLQAEEAVNEPLVIAQTPIFIGVIPEEEAQTKDFKGHLTEVRLWNHVRSQDAIKDNMFYRLTGGEQGLVGYWPLNSVDQNNTVSDRSENENQGKVYGAVIEGQLPYLEEDQEADKRQSVLKFDGKNDYVYATIAIPSDSLTASCWAKSDSSLWNGGGIFGQRSIFRIQPEKGTQKLWFLVNVGGWQKTICDLASLNIDITQWHYYTGTYDGQSIRLYVDGEQVSSTIHDGTMATSSTWVDAGYSDGKGGSSSGYFLGKITEAAIWTQALNGSEIKNIMLQRLSGKEDGLLLYWPLNEGAGKVANDSSANGKNGNIRGAAVWDEQFPLAIPPVKQDKSAVIKNPAFNLVADVAGGTAYSGGDVWGWWSNNGAAQKWTITPDGVITTHLNNSLALDLEELPNSSGWVQNVVLKSVDGSATQQWEILPSGVIKNKSNGLIMTMEDYGNYQKLIWAWKPLALGEFDESNPPAKAKWELINI
ncbi:MAG: LamG-like jellyroll fold domain-containing protein [Cyanobacteria bacterium J06592_8]